MLTVNMMLQPTLLAMTLDAPAVRYRSFEHRPPQASVLDSGGLDSAHIFWSNRTTPAVIHNHGCALPCGWLASDENGNLVAEGKLDGPDLRLEPMSLFPVGFYRFSFSRPSVNYTTAAVLRAPQSAWPPADTPVAIDTAQAWLEPCDLPTQSLVSTLAAAAGCGWTRDRLRWTELETGTLPSSIHLLMQTDKSSSRSTRCLCTNRVHVL